MRDTSLASIRLPARWAPPAWLVLVAALGWRAGYWRDVSQHPLNGWTMVANTVAGQPIFDAAAWDLAAEQFIAGQGIERQVAGRRPLWPLFLGLVYLWLGSDVAWAYAINIALGAATIALVYQWLAWRVSLPVAGAVAVTQLIWPCSLGLGYSAMSEPAGTFLFAVALIVTAEAILFGRARWGAAGGVLFGLANMTRTVTFFNLPVDAALMAWFRRRRGDAWGRALALPLAYLAAVAVVLSPFVVQHYQRTGALGISDVSNLLYCATSPEYGQYTPLVEAEANRAGKIGSAERYAYFMEGVRRNLREHFGLYARRARDTGRRVVTTLASDGSLILVSAVVCVGLALRGARRAWSAESTVGRLRCGVAALLAAWLGYRLGLCLEPFSPRINALSSEPREVWLVPLVVAIFAVGLARVIGQWRKVPMFLAASLVIGSVAGIAAIVNFDTRFTLPFSWAFQAVYFWGLLTAHDLLLGARTATADAGSVGNVLPWLRFEAIPWRWRRAGLAVVGVFTLVTAARLAPVLLWPPERKATTASQANTVAAISAIAQRYPDWLNLPAGAETGWLAPKLQLATGRQTGFGDLSADADVVVIIGKLRRQVYHFAPDVSAMGFPLRPFRRRPYDRSVAILDGFDDQLQPWIHLHVLVPGEVDRQWLRETVCFVGRAHRWKDQFGAELLFEGLALFPADTPTEAIDVERGVFFDQPEHQQIVRQVRRESAATPEAETAPPRSQENP